MTRTFEDAIAKRDGTLPLMVALMGFAHSGKTYCALTLGTGIRRVVGGELWVIGTEGDTALQYADDFEFRHVRLDAPFSGDDYLAAVEHCVAKGARLIVIDNMSYEHTGEGGMMDLHDALLTERVAAARQKPWNKGKSDEELELTLGQSVWGAAKEPRKRFERRVEYLRDRGVIFLLTYRADERYVPKKRGDSRDTPDHQWKVEGTSSLPYVSTLRWLLKSGCDGRATFVARTPDEAKICKTPGPYRRFMQEGQQINVELGEEIAKFARGKGTGVVEQKSAPANSAQRTKAAAPTTQGRLLLRAEIVPEAEGIAMEDAAYSQRVEYIRRLRESIEALVETEPKRAAGRQQHLDACEAAHEALTADEQMGKVG